MRRTIVGLAVGGALALAASAFPAASAEVTFTRDVAPIFQQKCEGCHRAGQMAPMSLVTYEEARPWARSIQRKVAARLMPPWHLDKTVGIQDYQNDISLSDVEIDTVVRWVEEGAQRGNPEDMPPPVEWPEGDVWLLAERLGGPVIEVR